MEATTLKYELSGDNQGLKKWFRGKGGEENFYHVHADEMTELERWIHGMLSSPNNRVQHLSLRAKCWTRLFGKKGVASESGVSGSHSTRRNDAERQADRPARVALKDKM